MPSIFFAAAPRCPGVAGLIAWRYEQHAEAGRGQDRPGLVVRPAWPPDSDDVATRGAEVDWPVGVDS